VCEVDVIDEPALSIVVAAISMLLLFGGVSLEILKNFSPDEVYLG
jgi:hypothetical protein